MEPLLVYFSSKSRNTERFVTRLGMRSLKLPVTSPEALANEVLRVQEDFVLIVPTYAGDRGENAVPKAVIQFLNVPENRKYLKAVVASGNRNFGKYYAFAGDVIAKKCQVPLIYCFELSGTEEDVLAVREKVSRLGNASDRNLNPL